MPRPTTCVARPDAEGAAAGEEDEGEAICERRGGLRSGLCSALLVAVLQRPAQPARSAGPEAWCWRPLGLGRRSTSHEHLQFRLDVRRCASPASMGYPCVVLPRAGLSGTTVTAASLLAASSAAARSLRRQRSHGTRPNLTATKAQQSAASADPASTSRKDWNSRLKEVPKDFSDCNDKVRKGFTLILENANAGRIAEAHEIIRAIREEVPDEKKRIMFNTAIKGCARKGELEVAEMYYKVMIDQGIKPNDKTFGKLMHASLWAKRPDACMRWFDEMIERKLVPNVVSLNSILQACCKLDDNDGAQHWLSRLEAIGSAPDHSSIGSLIEAAERRGDFEAAKRWFDLAMLD
mmetsp:Transcript_1301/g.3200  ORF Transcript_1301/g.3200 Transcript_1301/m.3200 type:complete len:350 (+) Transcript_1301:66-1115(+)